MTDFGYILIILFEILGAIFIIAGLICLDNKVKDVTERLNTLLLTKLQNIKNIRKNVENVNKTINKMKTFDYKKVRNALMLTLDAINFVMLFKSLKFQKGHTFTFKNAKKFLPFTLFGKILKEVKSFI